METHARSMAKAISWRLIAWVVTTIVVGVLTGQWAVGIMAGAADSLVKIGLYWGHERLWQHIWWGRLPTSSP